MAVKGAVLGDILGAQFEFDRPKNLDWMNVPLAEGDAIGFTDDTVMTLAIKKALKTGIFTDGKNNIKYDLSNLTYTVNDEVYTYPELREYLINVVPDNYNQQGIIDFSMDLFLISNIVLGNAHYDDTVILPYCEDLIHNYIADDEIAEGVLNTIYNKGLDTRLKVFEQYIVTD